MEASASDEDSQKSVVQNKTILVEGPSSAIRCNFTDPAEREKTEDISNFYFESDHLALKENKDYHALLRTLVVLETQKIQAIQDVDNLLEARHTAKQDPLTFVERLSKGENLGLPEHIVVAEVPQIDWNKYHVSTADEEPIRRPTKRTVKLMENFASIKSSQSNTKEKIENRSKVEETNVERIPSGEFLVRGRIFQTHKPVTFNQPWTNEEQKRLEELLDIYPTEETEMERWKKIAVELGNRTPVQVQSRVQKYFLKLHKAGLPIPGRLPPQRNKNRFFKPGGRKIQHGNCSNILGSKKSTFLTSIVPKVKMEEDDTDSCSRDFESKERISEEEESSTDEEGWPDVVRKTNEYKELRLLLRIRREKEYELNKGTVEHLGFSCSRCRQTPLLGTRWHCTLCQARSVDQMDGVDLCSDCVGQEYQAGGHTLRHKLRPVRETIGSCKFRDQDYD